MRLWTTMPARVYKETIEKTGIYQCDPDKSEVLTWDDSGRQFANAYDWMSRYMTEKIGPPPEGIKYGRGTGSAQDRPVLTCDGWNFGVQQRRWC